MLTVVMAVPPEVAANEPPFDEEDKLIVSARVVATPPAVSSVTVMGPRVALEDAAPETGAEVITSLVGVATMFSTWVPFVMLGIVVVETVIVGVPMTLSA
jgi:hypothetical protein